MLTNKSWDTIDYESSLLMIRRLPYLMKSAHNVWVFDELCTSDECRLIHLAPFEARDSTTIQKRMCDESMLYDEWLSV